MNRGWVLVTGGAKRLGRACALALAEAGFEIALHYNTSAAEAEATAEEVRAFGRRAVILPADLGDDAAVEGLAPAAAIAAGAALIGLVNSASIFEHDMVESLTAEAFRRHMAVNALAPARLAQALAAQLPAGARGAIVNFLDFKLAQPYPDHFSYTLSKYALAGATEMMARGLAPRIRVNAISPGYTLPSPGQAQADFERLHAQTPLAIGATPADIGAACAYLMTAPAVTGQTIFVDAGLRFRSQDKDLAFQ